MVSFEEPLTLVIEYSIACLCDFHLTHEYGASATDLRKAFVIIIDTLPIINNKLYKAACQHGAFEFILYYERVRLGIASTNFFLEGVPFGVQIFHGEMPTQFDMQEEKNRSQIRFKHSNGDDLKFRPGQVVAYRAETVRMIEEMKLLSDPRLSRDNDTTHCVEMFASECARSRDGFSSAVPSPVCIFIKRCRMVAQASRMCNPASEFAQCENLQCNRLFFTAKLPDSWSLGSVSGREGELGNDDDDVADSSKYWHTVANTCNVATDTPTRRFCDSQCAMQHSLQIDKIIVGMEIDADDAARRNGRARVAEAFKLALKRNEVASRTLRNSRAQVCQAVSNEEISKNIVKYTSQLNIDLGILYASSIIAESNVLSKGKLLPGSVIYWRDDPLYYAKALESIKRIYARTRRNEGIISNILTMPKFLEVLQTKAHTLF